MYNLQDPGARHKLIIGIDYGTTFSGVSYVTTDRSDIKDINIITSWPGEPSTSHKSPTRIAYQQENENLECDKWGFEVNAKVISYSWTKLLLDKNAEVGDYDDTALSKTLDPSLMKLPPFRTASGVCEDFLRHMYLWVNKRLEQQLGKDTLMITPVECWVTLPAIWSEEAKNATLQAAISAGFASRPGDKIFTIAEPEAAAIATLRKYGSKDGYNRVKANEHVLVCDCGGGTVDITTYKITQVQPHLSFDELCVGIGGKCGATSIDRNFHALLLERFGKAFDNVLPERKGPGSVFMASFEKCKRCFGYGNDFGVREIGPLTLKVESCSFYDDEERVVKLTYADMQRLFDPVIDQIIELLMEQVVQARVKKGARINHIILVGGFGESPYLNQRLTKWCKANGNINLLCPDNAQAAVVQGAALRGLEYLAPRMKYARRHYGFGIAEHFRKGIDREEHAFIDEFDNEKYCSGRMQWIIAKGESIFKDTHRCFPILMHFIPGQANESKTDLYSSVLSNPQERVDDPRIERVGSVLTTLPANLKLGSALLRRYNPRLGKTVYNVEVEVQIVFGNKGDNLLVRTVVNGQVRGNTTIEFSKN